MSLLRGGRSGRAMAAGGGSRRGGRADLAVLAAAAGAPRRCRSPARRPLPAPAPPSPPASPAQTATAAIGDARDDWKVVRALSEVLGAPLPYNSLDDVRRRLADVAPHFGRRDALEPPLWLNGEYFKVGVWVGEGGLMAGECAAVEGVT